MSIHVERMLMHWLTPITSSPCSRLVSCCMQSSSTQRPSSFPSDMVSKPTQSHDPTLHAFKSALTRPPPSQLQLPQTPGLFHKMATSFTTRDCSMSPTIRRSDWTSFALTMTIVWLDTLASPKRSRTSVVSSIGPEWSPSFIHSCMVCSRSKFLHHKPYGPYRFLPIGE